MVAKKARVVIVGAGMAGLTAASKLYTEPGSAEHFELCIVEAGDRIGGRIRTSHFGGDRIELGATYIHGIGGSPVHKIATETGGLHSEQPWERMDGFPEDPVTVAEGGFKLDSSIVDPISLLYRKLMDFAQGKPIEEEEEEEDYDDDDCRIAAKAVEISSSNGFRGQSIGDFLRRGLEAYWVLRGEGKSSLDSGSWSRRSLEEAIFAINENTERTYTSASDLSLLDFDAESEYRGFPGEEITIAKGYSSIIQYLASVLPSGVIQLGRKVEKIEWHPDGFCPSEDDPGAGPVKLHFTDGSTMAADHVIVTVSLGVLKAGIRDGSPSLFSPLLPSFKTDAISRLGFGVVNKLFLQLEREEDGEFQAFPFLQMAFQQNPSVIRQGKFPWWMRRTAFLCPIYKKSRVLLGWFAGEEALELESLKDSEIIRGVSATLSSFHPDSSQKSHQGLNSHYCNGNVNGVVHNHQKHAKFAKVLRSGWGTDPLFLGSYSFVAVGSSGEDLDSMAEPLPVGHTEGGASPPLLQLLFAGEATHRTHYSTTHGAYFSGIREAKRLLQHYRCGLP